MSHHYTFLFILIFWFGRTSPRNNNNNKNHLKYSTKKFEHNAETTLAHRHTPRHCTHKRTRWNAEMKCPQNEWPSYSLRHSRSAVIWSFAKRAEIIRHTIILFFALPPPPAPRTHSTKPPPGFHHFAFNNSFFLLLITSGFTLLHISTQRAYEKKTVSLCRRKRTGKGGMPTNGMRTNEAKSKTKKKKKIPMRKKIQHTPHTQRARDVSISYLICRLSWWLFLSVDFSSSRFSPFIRVALFICFYILLRNGLLFCCLLYCVPFVYGQILRMLCVLGCAYRLQ